MSEPHRFNLRVEPHMLVCFTCAKFEMDDFADVAWCAIGDPQFPALCARYEHRFYGSTGSCLNHSEYGILIKPENGDSVEGSIP